MGKELLKKLQTSHFLGFFQREALNRNVLIFCHDVVALFAAMQLAMWLVMREELALLEPGFILKESLIFTLISSGFFLWFQTYKGLWRYVSWRQSALLVGVLGFASLIFFPLITKAHMQPIAIPTAIVLVNWIVASVLLVGSRVFFRIFHERWSVADESLLTDAPMARVILVGAGLGARKFLTNLQAQKTHLYDVLGCVKTDPKLDTMVKNIDVMGSLEDLPDIIENFNTEGLHPHYIVFTDTDYFGSKARALLKNLAPFKVAFMKVQEEGSVLEPLTIEDAFYTKPHSTPFSAFDGKNILIYGAASVLGKELAHVLDKSPCHKVFLWDQNTAGLKALAHHLNTSKARYLSRTHLEEKQLTAYLKENSIDVVINLKTLSALDIEPHDSALSFEAYVQENDRFSKACEKAHVGHYCFITQEAPHGVLATQLTPVAGHLLREYSKKSTATFAAINLPYIISSQDLFFQGGGHHAVQQNELPIISPAYAVHMLAQIMSSILTKKSWGTDSECQMENISYTDLAELYSQLNHHAQKPTYFVQNTGVATTLKWNEETYQKMRTALDGINYNEAGKALRALYA